MDGETEWEWNDNLMCSLKCFSEKLIAWNRDTFGSIFKRKKRVRIRLEGVMKALDAKTLADLLKLESKLKREWSEVLLQEKQLWMQKSRVDWIRFGNKNTVFPHVDTGAKEDDQD